MGGGGMDDGMPGMNGGGTGGGMPRMGGTPGMGGGMPGMCGGMGGMPGMGGGGIGDGMPSMGGGMPGMGGGMPGMGGGMPGMGGGGGETDQAKMMAALQDPNDPGAGPALAALQAAQASGQGKGSCLVAAARAYEQATGRPMPGAPTGQLLNAAQGFNAQVDTEAAQAAKQAQERAAARKVQQAKEAGAKEAQKDLAQAIRSSRGGVEGLMDALNNCRSGGGGNDYQGSLSILKGIGLQLTAGQVADLLACPGMNLFVRSGSDNSAVEATQILWGKLKSDHRHLFGMVLDDSWTYDGPGSDPKNTMGSSTAAKCKDATCGRGG